MRERNLHEPGHSTSVPEGAVAPGSRSANPSYLCDKAVLWNELTNFQKSPGWVHIHTVCRDRRASPGTKWEMHQMTRWMDPHCQERGRNEQMTH